MDNNGSIPVLRNTQPRTIVRACDAYYECPKGTDGKRLGPLVGYTARDSQNRQYVGEIYVDFSKVEEYPSIVGNSIVPTLRLRLRDKVRIPVVFCGAPEGGKVLGTLLAEQDRARYIYPEKVVIELATATAKEKSKLAFGRHLIRPSDKVVIIEDVSNNFSTTDQLIALIEEAGGEVVAIVCFLNRSMKYRDEYVGAAGTIPIIAFWNEAMPEYTQDDEAVLEDLQSKNVIWSPKPNFDKLREVMSRN